ncbi:MAG: hypothetical protein AAGJ37_17495 [Pseudomonadota bacterium]
MQTKHFGITLALLSLISIFVMLHHPSISATDVTGRIAELRQESMLNAWVHGGLIAMVILINFCLTVFAQQRQYLTHSSALFGLIAYWLGTLAVIVAALISGFIIPQLAESYLHANATELTVFSGMTSLYWLTNQSLANFGTICWCVAICAWAIEMFRSKGVTRLFGSAYSIAALVIIFCLLSNVLTLSVTGMTLVLLVISTWQLGIAWLLYNPK